MDRDIEQKLQFDKKSSKKIYYIFVFLGILLVSSYYIFVLKNKETLNKEIEYITKSVKKGDLTVVVSATGNLQPTNSVDIGIEVSGTIKEIYVDFNDEVKKGQLMAKLDTEKLENEVSSNEAALLVAKANLMQSRIAVKNKKSKLERALFIYGESKKKYPSKEEIEDCKYEYESAVAAFDASRAKEQQALFNLKNSRENLQKATVSSSINGIVLNRNVEVGQTVTATMQTPVLFTVARDLSKMELAASIDEADIADIKEGLDVVFGVDAYGERKFRGVIKQLRLNPKEVSGVISYDAVVSVENKDLLLKPGMTATADIITKVLKGHLIIPNAALRYTPSTSAKKSASLTFSRPRDKKDTVDLDKKDERNIWVVRDSKPYKVSVKVLDSDGKNSAVISRDIGQDEKVIISQKNNHE